VKKIEPDITFKRELTQLSGSTLSECIQCGTCSVVCSLAPDDRPFPRKEMIWAAWGLPDKLLANPDLWLCHQCGDCTVNCPRGVRPSDVLASIRQLSYQKYARPRFFGKLVNQPRWLPVAILIPVVVIALILWMAGAWPLPEGSVNYGAFFPHAWLNSTFSLITLGVYAVAASGFIKFWKEVKRNSPSADATLSFHQRWNKAFGALFWQNRLSECDSMRPRHIAHLLVFFGFGLLLLVTLYAIVATLTGTYPLTLFNPFKIVGNLAGLMLLTGLTIMIINRLTNVKRYGKTGYPDWLLLSSFFLLTLSGGIVEAARFLDWGAWAYGLYFFHLVCVWFVIIYLPFSKFAHVIYRASVIWISD
jgi:quinone-modifying oxidoreductase, subunit QmoC